MLQLFSLYIGFAMRFLLFFNSTMRNMDAGSMDGEYVELASVAEAYTAMGIADAVGVLFACAKWVKFFGYASYSSPLRRISVTLGRASYMFCWAVLLLIVGIVAMVVLGNQLFGFDMRQFSTIGDSSQTLTLMLVGDVAP